MDRANEFRAAAHEISAAVVKDVMGSRTASDRRYAATMTAAEKLAEFQATKTELSAGRNDGARSAEHERDLRVMDHNHAVGTLMGNLKSAPGRITLYAADQAVAEQDRAERKQKQADGDFIFLELMRDYDVGAFIADSVFDPMSDSEIIAIVNHIEEMTGKSLEEYASEIIGPEAAARLPGESDADYRRRIVKDVAAEMIDPDDPTKIKPQYADDPLAQIIVDDRNYAKTIERLAQLREQANTDPAAAREGATQLMGESYEKADNVREHAEDVGVTVAEVRGTQDLSGDRGLQVEVKVENSASILDETSEAGTLDSASAKLNADFFAAASDQPKSEVSPVPVTSWALSPRLT